MTEYNYDLINVALTLGGPESTYEACHNCYEVTLPKLLGGKGNIGFIGTQCQVFMTKRVRAVILGVKVLRCLLLAVMK